MTRLEQADRTLFELIRRETVLRGFLPDILTVNSDVNWKLAKDTLRNSLPEKQLIEVFGVSPWQSKDEKFASRFVIRRKSSKGVTSGGFPVTYMTPVRDTSNQIISYNKYMASDARDIDYEIRVVSNLVKYERIMHDILDTVFGDRLYVRAWDGGDFDPDDYNTDYSTIAGFQGEQLFIEREGDADVSNEHYMERVFMYSMRNVQIVPDKLIEPNIKPINTIDFHIYYQAQVDNTFVTETITP